jgi:anhydro-N-acetylmuramic acid kinase
LVPIFHHILAARLPQPVAVLNIGGISNVTYVSGEETALLGFDTGPGNALIDDWIRMHDKGDYDADGHIAACGSADIARVTAAMQRPFFTTAPPKSLDRGDFTLDIAKGLSLENGAATLTALTAHAIAASVAWLPSAPETWILCGGGRRNKTLVAMLMAELRKIHASTSVILCEEVGWDGDAVEAQVGSFE